LAIPSPKTHPNAYAGITVGSIASLLVSEAKVRLNVDLTIEEAGMIVSATVALFLFLGKKVNNAK
jgi:hypothetical protein